MGPTGGKYPALHAIALDLRQDHTLRSACGVPNITISISGLFAEGMVQALGLRHQLHPAVIILVGNKICRTSLSILHHQFTEMPRSPPANTSICHQPLDTHSSPPRHTTPLGTIVAYPLARLWPYCWHTARFLAATRGDTGRILRRWCRRSRLTH